MLMCYSVTGDWNVIAKGLIGLQKGEPCVSDSSLCQRPLSVQYCVYVCVHEGVHAAKH